MQTSGNAFSQNPTSETVSSFADDGFPIPLYAAVWDVDSGKNKIGAGAIFFCTHTDYHQKISSDKSSEKE